MKTKFKVFISLLLTTLIQSSTIDFTCEFKAPKFLMTHIIGDHNWCYMIDNVMIHHENMAINASNVDENLRINGFAAVDKEIFYFPKGIDKFAKFLSQLVIKNCSLKEITSNNLQKFKVLQYLDLSHNQLKVLDGDLFSMDATILYLILNDNKIKFVHYSAFKTSGHVYLDFEDNDCFSKLADDGSKVTKLIEKLKAECRSDRATFKLIDNKMLKELKIESENHTDAGTNALKPTLYVVLILIVLLLISIITIMLYKTSNKIPLRINHSKHASINAGYRQTRDNKYEDQVFYEEIKYVCNTNAQPEASQIDDFYAELSECNETTKPELYADVYKSHT
ncbi:hypothetical protein ACKWTF_014156 [Chironomus riparius]